MRSLDTSAYVRRLGDIDLLKSYFLLVWTAQRHLRDEHVVEMEKPVREDFGGIETWHHRKDLIERLDYVFERFGGMPPGRTFLPITIIRYGRLRNLLSEADRR